MGLTGKTVEEQIWNFLHGKIKNAFGTAGLMGNLFAESGLNPENLQNSFQAKLGHTDDSYTKAVDNGTYSNFVKDSAGYGLAQWTFWSRKQNLHNFAKNAGKSIGDLEMQLNFLYKELSEGYKSVLAALKTATSVRSASDKVLFDFENPRNQGTAVQKKRAEYGQGYYQKYAVKAEGGKAMTEAQVRQKIVDIMMGWVGSKEADGTHKAIIDIYNGHKPLARNYKVKYTDAWCATAASAAAIEAGYTDIIPLECSCGNLITLAQKMGIWQENDKHVPEPGDYVLYDWDDKSNFAVTDNTGWPEHIGMVADVEGNDMKICEGNINDAVGIRSLEVNGRYIRGYICPKYETKATKKEVEKEEVVNTGIKVGDIVDFEGTKHYTSSYAGAKGRTCKPGQAKVTAINAKGAHPYHLVAVSGKGSNVYGWTDAKDIKGAVVGETTEEVKTVKKGSTVRVKNGAKTYTGNTLASFVYKRNHQVKEIKGDRAVITYKGTVVAAVKVSDLTLV